MKQDLTGSSSSPIEKMLVERVVTDWLRLGHVEALDSQHPPTNLKWAEFQLKRQAQAERQFQAAIDALATLRRLAKPITVEVRQPTVTPRVEPIIAGPLNGEMPPVNGAAKPINGHNRLNGKINGYNRIAGLLAPAMVE